MIPIFLEHMTDDFISLELFNQISKHNFKEQGYTELNQKICTIPKQILNQISDKNLDKIIASTLLQNTDQETIYKGINYNRENEGYGGPLVYLQFQEPINEFSITHVHNFNFGKSITLKGKSEDALYFFEKGCININGYQKMISPNTFIFLKNYNLYQITSFSNNMVNTVSQEFYPEHATTPKGIIITRFGQHEPIQGESQQKHFTLNEQIKTAQWGLMYLMPNKIAKPHNHKQKNEFFYFFNMIGMDKDIDLKNIENIYYNQTKDFVHIPKGQIHSISSTYQDPITGNNHSKGIWFHSINVPAVMNDSKRIKQSS